VVNYLGINSETCGLAPEVRSKGKSTRAQKAIFNWWKRLPTVKNTYLCSMDKGKFYGVLLIFLEIGT